MIEFRYWPKADLKTHSLILLRASRRIVMFSIKIRPMPDRALLKQYRDKSPTDDAEVYADCFSVGVDGAVVLSEFVFSFYTTPVFKLERAILKYLAAKPSSDYEAKQLSDGSIDTFAAWIVEERTDDQLLMCDYRGRTRSWFMVSPIATTGRPKTLLYFGSAVVPIENRKTGKLEIGSGFSLLLGVHKLYSQILLHSAKLRLAKMRT